MDQKNEGHYESLCNVIFYFHSRNMEHHINKIHKKALNLAHNDTSILRFNELLVKGKSVIIHPRNLQLLATEISKIKNRIALELTNDFFQFFKKYYNLKNASTIILHRKRVKTEYNGSETLSSLSQKCFELIPNYLKENTSLAIFKSKIKK